MHMMHGEIGVCNDCFADLPQTSSTFSFETLKTAEYLISPFYYKDKLKDAVLTYKFRSCHAYGEVFARLMYEVLSKLHHLEEYDLLIPIPLGDARMTQRGYNQAEFTARPFSKYINVEYRNDLMTRIRNTRRQSGLSGIMRRKNVLDAFSSADVTGKKILIFDDVYTTGNTMEECAKTLKGAGAKEVVGISFAVTDRKWKSGLF